MFPGTLDTKDGQAAVIRATGVADAMAVHLHVAASCMAKVARRMATDAEAGTCIDQALGSIELALAAIGYRMVPLDQPTPEEARRLALEEVDSRLVDLHWSASDDAEAGRVLALLDTRNIVWAMLSEPSK